MQWKGSAAKGGGQWKNSSARKHSRKVSDSKRSEFEPRECRKWGRKCANLDFSGWPRDLSGHLRRERESKITNRGDGDNNNSPIGTGRSLPTYPFLLHEYRCTRWQTSQGGRRAITGVRGRAEACHWQVRTGLANALGRSQQARPLWTWLPTAKAVRATRRQPERVSGGDGEREGDAGLFLGQVTRISFSI